MGAWSVTQADRDAATSMLRMCPAIAERVIKGEQDDHGYVQAFARHRIAHSTPGDAEVRSISVAEEWNVYMREAVNNAPEPLRKLGEYLAELLDEDQWKKAERYLNGALLATPSGRAQAWLPIETAPKDGTWFLAWFEGPFKPSAIRARWDDDRYARAPRPFFTSDDARVAGKNERRKFQPVAWQPLPAAPPAQDQTEGVEA